MFLQIGGPFCGCPYRKSRTVLGSIFLPLALRKLPYNAPRNTLVGEQLFLLLLRGAEYGCVCSSCLHTGGFLTSRVASDVIQGPKYLPISF